MVADEISRAEVVEAAAVLRAQRVRERAETRAEVKRLTLLADGERKRSLRVLQAKWHPDSWVGADGEAQAFAAEMAALVNAQAGVAREVAAKGAP